jgi:hypothetical protein
VFRWGLAVLSLCACTGEQVTPATMDSGATADTSAEMCPKNNLVPNGYFMDSTLPWRPQMCQLERLSSGPCGGGLRLFDCQQFGSAYQRVTRAFAAGTRVRLRAQFKKSGIGSGIPPAALVKFFRGPSNTEEIDLVGSLNADWTPGEATITLKDAADGFDIALLSHMESTATRDEWAMAAVVVETL